MSTPQLVLAYVAITLFTLMWLLLITTINRSIEDFRRLLMLIVMMTFRYWMEKVGQHRHQQSLPPFPGSDTIQ